MLGKVGSFLLLASLLAAAACSGGSDNGGSSTATPTPTHLGNETATSKPTSQATGAATQSAAPNTGGSGAASSIALDPCALVTQGEVAAAAGKPVGPGVSQNDGQQCQWEYSDPNDQLSGIDISLDVNADPEAFRESQQGGLGATAVNGVGDEAYFTGGGIVGILDFRKGTYLLEVGMNVAGSLIDQYPVQVQEGVEKAVALAALARIP